MLAVGFSNEKRVSQYFRTRTNNNSKYKKRSGIEQAMEEFFSEFEWIFLIQLKVHVNVKPHTTLCTIDDKITIIFEALFYYPELIKRTMIKGGDIPENQLDTLDINIAETD